MQKVSANIDKLQLIDIVNTDYPEGTVLILLQVEDGTKMLWPINAYSLNKEDEIKKHIEKWMPGAKLIDYAMNIDEDDLNPKDSNLLWACLYGLFLTALICFIGLTMIFQYRNPKANGMCIIRDFKSIITLEKVENFQ